MQSSINPEPVTYWGSSSNLLSLIFNGRAVYFEDTNDKKTKVRFVCENHVAVVSDPGTILIFDFTPFQNFVFNSSHKFLNKDAFAAAIDGILACKTQCVASHHTCPQMTASQLFTHVHLMVISQHFKS